MIYHFRVSTYIKFTSLEYFPQKERERGREREVYWGFVALCPRGFPFVSSTGICTHTHSRTYTHTLAQVGVIMRRLGLTLV